MKCDYTQCLLEAILTIVCSYLNEEIKCNDNSYTRYFNGLYTTYKVTRNYKLSLAKEYTRIL